MQEKQPTNPKVMWVNYITIPSHVACNTLHFKKCLPTSWSVHKNAQAGHQKQKIYFQMYITMIFKNIFPLKSINSHCQTRQVGCSKLALICSWSDQPFYHIWISLIRTNQIVFYTQLLSDIIRKMCVTLVTDYISHSMQNPVIQHATQSVSILNRPGEYISI